MPVDSRTLSLSRDFDSHLLFHIPSFLVQIQLRQKTYPQSYYNAMDKVCILYSTVLHHGESIDIKSVGSLSILWFLFGYHIDLLVILHYLWWEKATNPPLPSPLQKDNFLRKFRYHPFLIQPLQAVMEGRQEVGGGIKSAIQVIDWKFI